MSKEYVVCLRPYLFLQKPNGTGGMTMKYLQFRRVVAPVAVIIPQMEFSPKQVNNFWPEKGVESENVPSEKHYDQYTWL